MPHNDYLPAMELSPSVWLPFLLPVIVLALSFIDKSRSFHTRQILSVVVWALQFDSSNVPRNEPSIVPLPERYLTYKISCSRTAISVVSSAKMG